MWNGPHSRHDESLWNHLFHTYKQNRMKISWRPNNRWEVIVLALSLQLRRHLKHATILKRCGPLHLLPRRQRHIIPPRRKTDWLQMWANHSFSQSERSTSAQEHNRHWTNQTCLQHEQCNTTGTTHTKVFCSTSRRTWRCYYGLGRVSMLYTATGILGLLRK
jgi:hypothetical protein